MRGIISALSYLQKKSIFHGNISTKTLYFDEENGLFKIADEELINGEFHSFYQTRDRKTLGLIPPEFIPAIKNLTISEIR